MKTGFRVGLIARVRIAVTPEMTAQFEGKEIHPFYSTFWLAYHAELAARKLIEPYLTADVEGIGHKLSLTHHSPSAVGETVTVQATLTAIRGNKIYAKIEASVGKRSIARGTQVQALLPRAKVEALHRLAISKLNS